MSKRTTAFSDYVAEQEADPAMKAALDVARSRYGIRPSEIRHNCVDRWAKGRYRVSNDLWVTWTLTLWGARWAARRLDRQAARHGTVVK